MTRPRWLKITLPLAALVFSGCLAALPENRDLPVKTACLVSDDNTATIRIEIARSSSERSRGLMGRESLPADAGMLFVYNDERSADHSFWMYRTLIPLDIAYMGRDGTIRSIQRMQPCPANRGRDCPSYPAEAPFYLALEMNQGYFESRGFSVGDRLSLSAADCSQDKPRE
jgi:uncharacterized membrane protein (UPF0127 family)